MLGRELLVSLALGERLGGLNEAAAAVGIFFEVHGISLGLSRRPAITKARPEHRHWVKTAGFSVRKIKETDTRGGPLRGDPPHEIWGQKRPGKEAFRGFSRTQCSAIAVHR